MDSEQRLIVIIGAGVAGLQTSISLLQAGYRVLIISKHFPGDESIEYTSPWAGGHWRSHAAEADLEQQQWDMETYNHWLHLIEKDRNHPGQTLLSGLGLRKSRFYSASSDIPWYSRSVLSYEPIPGDSLGQGIQHGHMYTSIMVNVPMYLHYLYETARSLGAIDIRATLPRCSTFSGTLQTAADVVKSHLYELGHTEVPQISAFVNATGISALNLVPDPALYPIRGQTVTVAGEASQITTIDAFPSDPTPFSTPIMYILPRPHSNTTVLGGTKQIGDWNAKPDLQTTDDILRRAKEWAPELLNKEGEFEVLSVQVGLRPGRKGGARVEIESLDGLVVCHAYGHAGAGYQNSVGSANKVVRLLENWFQETKIGESKQ